MPRGHPDFGATAPRELTTPQLDSGELAARLGSPDVYDRLGAVVGLYTADQPGLALPGSVTGGGRVDSFVASSPFGAYVWRLTVTADGDRIVREFRVPYIGDTPVACEVIWRLITVASVIPEIVLIVDNAANRTTGAIRFDQDTTDWQHRSVTGAFVDTPTQPPDPASGLWHVLKFSVDPIAQTYGRARFDGQEFDLSGIDADDLAGTSRTIAVQVTAEGHQAGTLAMEVAAVIVTVNEL